MGVEYDMDSDVKVITIKESITAMILMEGRRVLLEPCQLSETPSLVCASAPLPPILFVLLGLPHALAVDNRLSGGAPHPSPPHANTFEEELKRTWVF